MDSDVAERSEMFMQWLKATPSTRISPHLTLENFTEKGRGRAVVAQGRTIAEGEELFAIPRNLVLNVRNSDLQQHITTYLRDLGPWLSLMLVMLYEYLRESKSQWYPYFKVLPQQFDTLMFWTAGELHELQGSAVKHKIGKEEAEESILKTLLPIVNANPLVFPPSSVSLDSWNGPLGEETLLRMAHIMGSLIMAYAFDIEEADLEHETCESDEESLITDDEEDPPKGMVPLADMLNADADLNNARLFHEDHFLVMKAVKNIKAGEEILNDYGPLPRSDLLRRYGYVSQRYSQYDVVEIPLNLVCEEAGFQDRTSRLQPLDDLGLLEDGYLLSRPRLSVPLLESIPHELMILIQTLLREEVSKRQVGAAKPRLGSIEVSFLRKLVGRRQAEYTTTLSQDREMLKLCNQDGYASNVNGSTRDTNLRRLKMAIEVRMGEKEILNGFSTALAALTDEGKSGSGKRSGREQSGPDSKRAKHPRD